MSLESRFVAWCKSVIHHAVLNAIRAKSGYAHRETPILNQTNAAGQELIERIPYDPPSYGEVELKMVLDALPPIQRDVLTLLYVYGYTQRETAGFLHTTQQQVCQMRKCALLSLRREMSVK